MYLKSLTETLQTTESFNKSQLNLSTFNTTSFNNSSWNVTAHNSHTMKYQELQILVSLVMICAGLVVNTGVILLFVLRRRNFLLANLAVSNYIGIIVITLHIINTLSPPQPSDGEHYCKILLSITEFWWISQNFTLLAISYERYKQIADPMPCIQDTICRKRYNYVIFIWVVSIAAVLILLKTTWITLKFDTDILRCRKNWELHPVYMMLYSFGSFWMPGFPLMYFHGYMCYKGYKVKQFELRPYSTTTMTRSRSLNSLVSLREYLSAAVQMPIRRLSRSESLPSGLEDPSGRSDSIYSSGSLSIRKKSITQTALKPIFSTLLILLPYLLAAGPEVVLIYIYSKNFHLSQELDLLVKAKYFIVAYFPFILCWTDKKIRKDIRRLTNKLSCCRSTRINPNIEPEDYRENIIRRDSRRNSMVSRQNSYPAQEEIGSFIPPVAKEGKSKSSPQVGTLGASSSRDPIQIIHFSTPVNMPAVEVTDLE
eukprot:TCONS_00005535-protein